MKTGSPYDRNNLHIKSTDKVLEIGPGDNPCYRSNVIVEKFLNTDIHRCGELQIYEHQQLVHADGENLPFGDKEFDYIICNQVLEHVENPVSFVKELYRVGKRGYIETPSLIGEFLFPKQSHKWVILDIDGKLVMYEKSKMPGNYKNDYGELFLNYLPYQSLPFKLLWLTDGNITMNKFEWKDDIEVIVNPNNEYYSSFFLKNWDREMVEKICPPRSVFSEIIGTSKALYYLIKSKIQTKFSKHGHTINLTEYLKTHTVLGFD